MRSPFTAGLHSTRLSNSPGSQGDSPSSFCAPAVDLKSIRGLLIYKVASGKRILEQARGIKFGECRWKVSTLASEFDNATGEFEQSIAGSEFCGHPENRAIGWEKPF